MKTSSFCIACCLWAAASCSTSAGAESGVARAPRGAAGRALELELALARGTEVYLALDTAGRRLAVKARGLELAAEPLADAVVVRYRRRGGESAGPPPALPLVLEVRAGDGHRRRVVVTGKLEPFPGDGNEEARRDGGAPGRSWATAATGSVGPDPPQAYRLALDPGWELWVGARRGGPGPGALFDAGLADLWARLRGRPSAERNVIALAIAPEGARRIHHLLRPGARLLVL